MRKYIKFGLYPALLLLALSGCATTPDAEQTSSTPYSGKSSIQPLETKVPDAPKEATISISNLKQMPFSSVLNPNDQGNNFWQIVDPANGYPEDGGTKFILAHACSKGNCIGDDLRNLVAGDVVDLKGQNYQVQEKRIVAKDKISELNIWTHDPNRVVFITCVIINGDWANSAENEIIIAKKIS